MIIFISLFLSVFEYNFVNLQPAFRKQRIYYPIKSLQTIDNEAITS